MAVIRQDIDRIAHANAAVLKALEEGRPKNATAIVCTELAHLARHQTLRRIYAGVPANTPDAELLREWGRRLELFANSEQDVLKAVGFNSPEAPAMLGSVCAELRPQFVNGVLSERYPT